MISAKLIEKHSRFMDIQEVGTEDREGQEKRNWPRFAVSQMIDVRFDRERWIHARGIDLSATGLRCRTAQELDPGASIFLMLALGGEREFSADAVLIHTQEVGPGEFEAGFAFTTFHGSSRETLLTYLDSLDEGDER